MNTPRPKGAKHALIMAPLVLGLAASLWTLNATPRHTSLSGRFGTMIAEDDGAPRPRLERSRSDQRKTLKEPSPVSEISFYGVAHDTGVNGAFLERVAYIESHGDTFAHARGTSAEGLFQFTDATFLKLLADHGQEVGVVDAKDYITKSGQFHKAISQRTRDAILALKDNPVLASKLEALKIKDDAALLQQKIGRPPTNAEIYAAHFLGVTSAINLIAAAVYHPQLAADRLDMSAAWHNHSIFYQNNIPRTAAEIMALFQHRTKTSATN